MGQGGNRLTADRIDRRRHLLGLHEAIGKAFKYSSLKALIDSMEALEGARWQDDEQLHLTLRFIGEVERPVADDLAAALSSIVWPSFELALEGVSHFERKGMPTAIWARVLPTPELNGLRTRI